MFPLFKNTKYITRASGIYYIKINEINYVGSSVDVKTRLSEHKNSLIKNKHVNIRLQRTFNKYGKDKCWFSILETIDINTEYKDLLKLEKKWIDLLGPIANFKQDPTTQFNSDSQSKKVFQYDLNGHKINNYPSTKEAQRQTKIMASSIIQNCNGKLLSAGGYLWSYEDKIMKTYNLKRSKWKWVSVYMLDTQTDIFSEYENIANAARSLYKEGDKFDSLCSSISSICKKKGHLLKNRYRFAIDKNDLLIPLKPKKRGILEITNEGIELEWDSITDLCKSKHISPGTVYKVLNNKKESYKGSFYKYRE